MNDYYKKLIKNNKTNNIQLFKPLEQENNYLDVINTSNKYLNNKKFLPFIIAEPTIASNSNYNEHTIINRLWQQNSINGDSNLLPKNNLTNDILSINNITSKNKMPIIIKNKTLSSFFIFRNTNISASKQHTSNSNKLMITSLNNANNNKVKKNTTNNISDLSILTKNNLLKENKKQKIDKISNINNNIQSKLKTIFYK